MPCPTAPRDIAVASFAVPRYTRCVRWKLNPTSLHTLGGLAAIVLWSGTFALARSLSERTGPLSAAAAAYLIGGALCFVPLGSTRSSAQTPGRLDRRYLLGCGALFVLYTAFIYLAVGLARNREQVLEVALINYLWPSATVLLSLPLLRHRAGPLLLPGTALALAGVFLVMTHGARVSWTGLAEHVRENPVAYALALLAALVWALYSNLVRRWSAPDSSGAVRWFLPATGLVLLGMRMFFAESTTWSAAAVVEAITLGIITALAYAWWDGAMRRGHHLVVVVCSYFTPLLSTLVSCAYLKVAPGSRLWIGCLLLVGGSLLTAKSVWASAPEEIDSPMVSSPSRPRV